VRTGINFGGDVKEQQRETTGWADDSCTTTLNCLQIDGSGYYIIDDSENSGVSGHEVYVGGVGGFTNEWVTSTGQGFMWASFNWLAQRASGAIGVDVLAAPTGARRHRK